MITEHNSPYYNYDLESCYFCGLAKLNTADNNFIAARLTNGKIIFKCTSPFIGNGISTVNVNEILKDINSHKFLSKERDNHCGDFMPITPDL